MKKPKVLIALSGGVDSSMAAFLLKEQGYDLIGVTFKVFGNKGLRKYPIEHGIRDAKKIAGRINIPYYLIDLIDDFEEQIINYFVKEYANGRTPNPCALCNYQVKWSKLIEIANELGCDYVATGHYAEIGNQSGRYFISEANDSLKDQSSFLWRLTQEFLRRTMFPLGNLSKKEIKRLAEDKGFDDLAKKQESYNICFIPDGDYRKFLAEKLSVKKGKVTLADGTLIGYHQGVWNYTLGQKKDITAGIDSNYCVTKIDAVNNEIVVGNQKQLQKTKVEIESVVFQKYENIVNGLELKAKIKYRGELLDCKVKAIESKKLHIQFNKPVDSLVPGQSIVLFENNDLVAGGVII
jgi:tRNA-specific 2-thiouridylase